ncbi:cysteine hydrolase family protein [Paenibacillus humicola]|uniref:cysteine hydrolase family protein n=1 Tax=Paenibacillus humicola TaxID=3110540 RepID=UPI00237AE95C|nr:cysteine hydrolase family protein [Paenibacillus humicola]
MEKLTNGQTALLVVDVQQGMFMEAYPVYDGDGLLERIRGLIAKARASHVPVIYVQHNEGEGEPLETNTSGWEIHSSIAPAPGETIIQKRSPDAFHDTNLQEELAARGIERLVLTGMATDYCIDATCRGAIRLGYQTIVVEDAHSTNNSTAAETVSRYNESFRSMTTTCKASDIEFGESRPCSPFNT